jgi:3-oxoacyl-[acyl-carrier-protein] synthase-1
MAALPIAILSTGMVTAVGLTAPASCAAIRAKLSNPTQTRFIDAGGEWIFAHQVTLEQAWRGLIKLSKMASMAIAECLDGVPREQWSAIPLLLCVAEQERPGRLDGLDDALFADIEQQLGVHFASESAIVPHGRVGAVIALARARAMLNGQPAPFVVIAAADSLLTWPTLSAYARDERLLRAHNSNGFMPGEGSAAVLLGRAGENNALLCAGIGFGLEKASIDSSEPLRADGLATALREALAGSGTELHQLDYRITDLSGEQYYFKEAALALARILRSPKEEFDIWHPAECIGETGAVAGVALLAVADAAWRKGYAAGPSVLVHIANDAGQRAAVVLRSRAA